VQFVYICLHSQGFEFYHEIGCILSFLFEHFNLLFGIYCLCLVTKCHFDFSYKVVPILGSYFFIQLIELLLGINACYASSKAGKDHYNLVINLYDPITFKRQPYLSLLVFKFHPISIELFWIWDHALRHSYLSIVLLC